MIIVLPDFCVRPKGITVIPCKPRGPHCHFTPVMFLRHLFVYKVCHIKNEMSVMDTWWPKLDMLYLFTNPDVSEFLPYYKPFYLPRTLNVRHDLVKKNGQNSPDLHNLFPWLPPPLSDSWGWEDEALHITTWIQMQICHHAYFRKYTLGWLLKIVGQTSDFSPKKDKSMSLFSAFSLCLHLDVGPMDFMVSVVNKWRNKVTETTDFFPSPQIPIPCLILLSFQVDSALCHTLGRVPYRRGPPLTH